MSQEVQEMFGRIARRYDRANTILSFGVHHGWRRNAVKATGLRTGGRALDVACGTGDLSFALLKAVGAEGAVTGSDFTPEMLEVAHSKADARGAEIDWQQADAMDLPFDDDAFDAATIAFGIRNVDEPAVALSEMHRVVRPGGRVVVLEFGQPRGGLGIGYRFYSRHIMPRIGGLITGDRAAYEYLPRTAAEFPAGDAFVDLMEQAAPWNRIDARPLTGGVAYIYTGVKPAAT